MTQVQTDMTTEVSRESTVVELALKDLWERVREATELIERLKNERQSLGGRVEELEKEVTALRSEVLGKEQDLKRLRMEHIQLLSSDGRRAFSEEEKEVLKGRIRELIAKVNSHL